MELVGGGRKANSTLLTHIDQFLIPRATEREMDSFVSSIDYTSVPYLLHFTFILELLLLLFIIIFLYFFK